jgi:hypothetical protein
MGSVHIPEGVVAEAGRSFVRAAATDPGAWESALDLVSYRSSLSVPKQESPEADSGFSTYYHQNLVAGKPGTRWSWGGPLTRDGPSATKWDFIGREDERNTTTQPSWLFATGGATSLDRMNIRHAVLTNVEVHFSGKPCVLEDVLFVNCSFVFDNNEGGRSLADEILRSPAVSFTAS